MAPADLTDYLLELQPNYFHLDNLFDFIHKCSIDALKMLEPVSQLFEILQKFSNENSKIVSLDKMSRNQLFHLLKRFNIFKIESVQIKMLKNELLFRIWIQSAVRELLMKRYVPTDLALLQLSPNDYGLNRKKVEDRLENEEPAFKALAEELKFFKSNLTKLEDPCLEGLFREFLRHYLETLGQIHEMMNRKVTVEEVKDLKSRVESRFRDCTGLSKKIKELMSVALNQKKLEGVISRIEEKYRKHDPKRSWLESLKKGECEVDLEVLEREFGMVYEEGKAMDGDEDKGFLSSMKKAYETYLNLRKKEKDLDELKELFAGKALIGKRGEMEGDKGGEKGVKRVKVEAVGEERGTGGEGANGKGNRCQIEVEDLETPGKGVETQDKADHDTNHLQVNENPGIQNSEAALNGQNRTQIKENNNNNQEVKKMPQQGENLNQALDNKEAEKEILQIQEEIKEEISANPTGNLISEIKQDIKNEFLENDQSAIIKAIKSEEIKPEEMKIENKNRADPESSKIEQEVAKVDTQDIKDTQIPSKQDAPTPLNQQNNNNVNNTSKESHEISEISEIKQTAPVHNKIIEEEPIPTDPQHQEILKIEEEIDEEMESELESEDNNDSLKSVFESEISSCESVKSNEFILKQRKQIRKLKNLVITKREEQNKLVNEAEERTSAFLFKKFSLVLLYYKLRVLGLDPETAAKTETYLKTVRDTDQIMKRTALDKVTSMELKQLVLKCENMKYFSQGYQKFKRLSNLFETFLEAVRPILEDFRGDLRISFELRDNFRKRADLSAYKIDMLPSKQKLVLSRKGLRLLGEDSKQKWVKLSNKRKTKLRQNFGAVESNPRAGKRRPKEKILHAIYIVNKEDYCLCQERYELTSMLQFSECDEWFHKECIKIPKYQMRKTKEKFCPACFFLHPEQSEKFRLFSERKRPFVHFLNVYKSARILGKFLLDSSIDEVFYIHQKLNQLHQRLADLLKIIELRRAQSQALSPCWKQLHTVTLLYLYIPVHIESVQTTLKQISLSIISESSPVQPDTLLGDSGMGNTRKFFIDSSPPEVVIQDLPEHQNVSRSQSVFVRPQAVSIPVKQENHILAVDPKRTTNLGALESKFNAVRLDTAGPGVQLVMKGVEVVQVPAQGIGVARTGEQAKSENPTQPHSVAEPKAKTKSIYGSLLNSAYLEMKKEKMEQSNGGQD